MIEFDNVTHLYQGGRGVSQVNLQVEVGSVTCLVGCNGSGKSTLLKLAAGLLKPQSGHILYGGKDLSTFRHRQRAVKIAMLAQGGTLPPQLAIDVVLSGRYPHRGFGVSYSGRDLEIAKHAMERTRCADFAEKRMDRLSGGERQRVLLAAALAQDTDVLLLDEPTVYLDASVSREIMELVRELNFQLNKTIVMVLHDIQLALRYSDRMAVLIDGQLRAEGEPDELAEDGILQSALGVEIKFFQESGSRYYCVV